MIHIGISVRRSLMNLPIPEKILKYFSKLENYSNKNKKSIRAEF
jgi:hypothetical protein